MTSAVDNMEQISAEQDQLFSIISSAQRGRIDEQRCTLGPTTPKQVHANSPDADDFFQFLVNSQSQRLDDQRVTLNALPGMEAFTIRDPKDGNVLKTNFDQFCNMVSRAHSFRKRNTPKNTLTPGAQDSVRRASFSPQPSADSDTYNTLKTRSASFNPISDKDRMESFQHEQDQLFSLVSQAQCGRMDEQRCSINPLSPSPKSMDNSQADQDIENFFKLISNTQNRRFDDQRATLNLLPGKQAPSGMTDQDSDQLFNMVSRMQGSRIDDQRCSAPKIQLGTPAPPRKSHSQPVLPTNPPSSRRSGSFSPSSEVQNSIDEDQFFALVHHAQQGRMDDQRCSFEPFKKTSPSPKNPNANPTAEDPEQFFKLVTDFQRGHLDDQRATLNTLPGLQPREKNKVAPQIMLTPASPAPPKKICSSPSSPTLTVYESDIPGRPPSRSASFCPVSDKEGLQYDDRSAQITFQISMCFPPHQTLGANNQPYTFPEVFLTIGQPGETIVIPLSPKPGRPLSLNVNPPKNHRSRSKSPHKSPARQGRSRPSSPHPGDAPSPLSPYEDYFSLIQRVHTAQLQQNNRQDSAEPSKEARKGKEKSSGKKEKKEGNKEKKK
ncbi:uncharacterized protein LOC125267216 isoform X1 [Megalobrama amblycephala]|uniref:uncharacterized protein LOC125267216 isoform X1 n=1 Tax=Megalobrama amblycephala TaxID=75352 RepID=UPI00201448A5|nr:uncharacterized protein LOC125267216 isoform X1 [Megalobrama amblycephala]